MVPFQQRLLDADLAFSTAFLEGVESVKEGIDLVYEFKTQTVSMPGTEEVVFGFLAEMPLFRKWIGERRPQRLSTGEYSVKQGDWEFSYALKRNDVKYDKVGIIANTHFRSAGVAQKRFPCDLITQLQTDGKTATCYDGQFFYDTDHPVGFNGVGTTTFQNLWTSMTLNVANVTARYKYMTQLKDANGKRMGIRPNIIEYGPGQFDAIRNIFEADIISEAISSAGVFGGTSNVVGAAPKSNTAMRGLLIPIMNPDLEDSTWFLHDTRVMKPFMYVVETPPTGLISRVDPQDPHVWQWKEYLYGAEATAVGAYTLPHLSTRCEE
jgi:phage major head subunit gpT-like protein